MSDTRRAPVLHRSCEYILGVDEVGLGAWAGPMCVGGVLAPRAFRVEGVRDSKKMTRKARESKIDDIYVNSVDTYAVLKDAQYIVDKGHRESWVDAVVELSRVLTSYMADPSRLSIIIDGSESREVRVILLEYLPDVPVYFVPKADDLVPQVAAASVMAKVYRDELMRDLHELHPQFDWAKNKGYGVPVHIAALEEFGATEYHREHARNSWPKDL